MPNVLLALKFYHVDIPVAITIAFVAFLEQVFMGSDLGRFVAGGDVFSQHR